MEKNRSLRHSSVGSLSLEVIFSIGAGVLAALFFSNLAGYVGAKGAVKQGAIAALRCLTPTDADCQAVTASGALPGGTWHGRLPDVADPTVVYLPRANYSLSYTGRTNNLSFTPFLLNLVQPEVAWREVTVPRLVQSATLNLGENSYGTLTVDGSRNWYELAETFPPFSQDENQDPDSWVASNSASGATSWRRTYGLIDPSRGDVEANRAYSHGPLTISGGQTQQFVSNWITVPKLNGNFPCRDNDASNCSPAEAAGDAAAAASGWQDFTYVAVKASAKVFSTAGNPSVGWKQTPSGSAQTSDAGLYIVIENEQGQQTWRRLGCRDWSPVRRGEQNAAWYNLWLRGPAGANGGPVANSACGNNDYDSIRVPRGGKFQFVGSLAAQGGTVQAEVVYLYHLADVAQRQEVLSAECENIRYSFKSKAPLCPESLSACNAPQGFAPTSANWCKAGKFEPKDTYALCSESQLDQHSKRYNGERVLESEGEASCSGAVQNTLQAPDGRSFCGEVKTEKLKGEVIVVGKNQACPAATKESVKTQVCDAFFVKNSGYKTSDCEISKAAGQGWFNGKFGAQKQWLRPDASYQGKSVPAQKLAAVNLVVPEAAVKDENGNVSWKYSNSACAFEKEIAAAAKQQVANPDVPFVASCEELKRHISLTQSKAGPTQATGYPFDEEVDALYYGQEGSYAFEPSESSCSFKTSCDNYQGSASLEELLLQLAKANNPALAALPQTAELDYTVTEAYTKTRQALPSEYAALSAVCAPMDCEAGRRRAGYWEPVSTLLQYPPECADGTYVECRYQADSYVEGPVATMQFAEAEQLRQIATQELGRVRLDARDAQACNGAAAPGCVDLALDIDQATSVAEVKVTYNLPVGFPLSMMLGTDVLPVESTVREPVELLMFAR